MNMQPETSPISESTGADSHPPARLEMRGLSKTFSAVRVLHQVNLTARAGEVHGLVGENGAGKSTLMKILSGELARDKGEIFWEGSTARIESRSDSARLGISMIHQELSLAPHLSVAANIFLGREPGKGWGMLDRSGELREANRSLAELGFDEHLDASRPVGLLNPAQKQMVEIARALTASSRLIIMDEPTSSLSNREVEELFSVVERLKQRGVSIIFVTHRLEELARIADGVTVLRDGEVVHSDEMPRKDFSPLIRAMVGRELRELFPARKARPGGVVLKVENLWRRGMIEKAGLELRRGEVVGLAGLIGAGCTELVETLFGAWPAETGEVRIEGKPVSIRAPQDAIRAGMVLITEDHKTTGLALPLPLSHNISLANLAALVRAGKIGLREEKRVAQGFIERLRIRASSVNQKVSSLSGGNQQKAILAKWLFCEPRIFLLDEPTRGVDVGSKQEIYRLINELAEAGAAILMISSELEEILGMSDRVLVMRAGRIVKELVTRETSQEEIMHYAALASSKMKDPTSPNVPAAGSRGTP